MTEGLAIHGGRPAVRRALQPFSSIAERERAEVIRFLDSGAPLSGFHGSPRPSFFGGPEVVGFEAEWRKYFGVEHAVAVNSATSGLIAAMGAIGIGPGDEVIVPPYTMTATAIAPLFYGGIPVFADIEADYFCLDVNAVERAITSATRAIIVVNLFGHPAELRRLRELADARGIFLVEDNAQAALACEDDGRLAGTIGHIGIYSLNVHKHVQTGEGGICVTADSGLARRLQLIRNHGENVVDWLEVSDLCNLVGFNIRMTELIAAVGKAQLDRIQELVGRAEAICQRLTKGLSDIAGFTPPAVRPGCRHNYYMWSAKIDPAVVGCSRAAFSRALTAEGFPNAEGYVLPIYKIPMFQRRIAIGRDGFPFSLRPRTYPAGLCPVTEAMHEKHLLQFQPVSWHADEEQVEMMIDAVRKVHAHASALREGVQ
jgi:dTDP-4-amino-4,6-dideoxygalactose transaminase